MTENSCSHDPIGGVSVTAGVPTERCPWCNSNNPDIVGRHKGTEKVCRDSYHCPIPDSHSANGGPFRYCQYCDWREEPSKEPPGGMAVNWAESDPPSIRSDIRGLALRWDVPLTDEQVELLAAYFDRDVSS